MPQFFVAPSAMGENRAVLDARESHHLRNVFAVNSGDEVELFDGCGKTYRARVSGFSDSGQVEVEIISTSVVEERGFSLDIMLGQCVFQFARMDEMVRAVCELGAMRLLPVISERSNFSRAQIDKRAVRWEKIVMSAVKQCGRTRIMDIAPACSFSDSLKFSADFDIRVYGSIEPCAEDVLKLRQLFKSSVSEGRRTSVFVLIGPEGGMSESEEEQLSGAGFFKINTSPNVLRAGTAASALCSVLQYEAGVAEKLL